MESGGMGIGTPEEMMAQPMQGVSSTEGVGGQTPMPGSPTPGMGRGMPAEGMGGEEEAESNVSPEEQALYHKFMENYYTIMYVGGKGQNGKQEPPAADQVVQDYFAGDIEDPTDALANAAMTLVKNFADSAANSGKPIPGDVLMHAGTNEVLPDLAELAEKAGYHEYTDDELNNSLFKAMDMYQAVNTESLNKDELNQDFQSMMQADKEGRLGEVLPGIEKAAEHYAPPQGQGQEQVAPERGQVPTRGLGRV